MRGERGFNEMTGGRCSEQRRRGTPAELLVLVTYISRANPVLSMSCCSSFSHKGIPEMATFSDPNSIDTVFPLGKQDKTLHATQAPGFSLSINTAG